MTWATDVRNQRNDRISETVLTEEELLLVGRIDPVGSNKTFPHSDARRRFLVLLTIDQLQERATVYSVARVTGYTRSFVQTALRVATEQFGVVFERVDAAHRIVHWGVLNKSALTAFIGFAEKAFENRIAANQIQTNAEKDSTPGIRRVDDELAYARRWQVTINLASGQYERIFSDGAYGGTDAAFHAALNWYNEKVLECPLMPRVERVAIVRRNNTSGTPGVFRWPADGREERNAYWAAKWVETAGAKPVAKKFFVKRYGDEAAKRMAIAAREDALAGLID